MHLVLLFLPAVELPEGESGAELAAILEFLQVRWAAGCARGAAMGLSGGSHNCSWVLSLACSLASLS